MKKEREVRRYLLIQTALVIFLVILIMAMIHFL